MLQELGFSENDLLKATCVFFWDDIKVFLKGIGEKIFSAYSKNLTKTFQEICESTLPKRKHQKGEKYFKRVFNKNTKKVDETECI